jgi:hypothetical protein
VRFRDRSSRSRTNARAKGASWIAVAMTEDSYERAKKDADEMTLVAGDRDWTSCDAIASRRLQPSQGVVLPSLGCSGSPRRR